MIQNLISGVFFDNIISGIQIFIFVHTFLWTSSVFFLISDFLVEILKANKTSEKYHLFYNPVSLKKSHSFYKPRLTWHWK